MIQFTLISNIDCSQFFTINNNNVISFFAFSKQILFFRTVSDLQKNGKDNTENSHIWYTQFPLLKISYIGMVFLL